MSSPTPFTVDIPQEKIDTILKEVRAYEWHEMPEIAPDGDRWAYGTDMDYMRELCGYWTESFDWRAAEAKLNAVPQFLAEVDGLTVHFIHVKGSGANPETLLLTHGWPGSVFEFYDAIETLAHPEKFGGKAEDGINLVIPSLPGYGFSGKPKKPMGPRATAALWDKLMREVLGYETYIAQGGDWAIHVNMNGLRPPALPETEEEVAWTDAAAAAFAFDGAYLQIQMTKPQTLSYAMMDSPVGAAAWIVEKFHSWSDRRHGEVPGHLENAFSKDAMLTGIMIYLVTRSFNTAIWFYRGMMEEGGTSMAPGTRVEVPTGMAKFPQEAQAYCIGPRSYMEKGFNIVHWSELDRGGHFAAWETGRLFADEVMNFVKKIKG